MSTVIATTVRFQGRERAVFTAVGDWIGEDPEIDDADVAAVRAAGAGEALQFGTLVALLEALDRVSDQLAARIERDGSSSPTGLRAGRAAATVSEARRIVVTLVSLDEVMFGNTEYDLCSA